MGAARPDFLSISALYRSIGWRVIAIEPNPVYCEAHREQGHEVYPYACGDRDEDNIDFVVVDSHGTPYGGGQVSYESFSSIAIKDSYAAIKQDLDTSTIKVNLRRLDTILKRHAPELGQIDIFSVDVEGWELEVLTGLDFAKHQPKVMIIENLFQDQNYRSYMDRLNYVLWGTIAPNDIYVNKEFMNRVTPGSVVYAEKLWVSDHP